MKEYLLSIVGITLISSILSTISPNGKMNGIVKSGARLLTLLVILSPVIDYFSGDKRASGLFSDFYEETVINLDESFIEYCSEKQVEYVEEKLREEIALKYSVDVQVDIATKEEKEEGREDSKIRIEYILLQGVDEDKKAEIIEFIEKKYGCEVRYDKG